MAIIQSTPIYVDQVYRRELINVFFRFIDGKTLCLNVDPSNDDIFTIKKQLIAKSDFPLRNKDLFLVWNGKPLDDDGIVSDYALREGATVVVSYRNKGGCFMVSFSILIIIMMAIVGSTCTCGLSLCVIPFLMPLLFILPLFFL